jgi:hypothetical protein
MLRADRGFAVLAVKLEESPDVGCFNNRLG